ncbi:hypothetical protein BCV69DRAFT_287235 [Microstroma glucosiphilum]|uniref:SH3 domain-containing protein n=1 Tax=Pseudomicrostroma glucosiphilum TaxID=1684307 RepID=A0A316U8V0_9BASI|nr:hypothetical protein BCV69DRAFT_287235 [Pseudomicrostroma glucosiphilum]PWN21592.1 hypothetical protein BCV69DRAFT_287235 [Pseudomicrostroma glucosiphilum]
MPTNSSYSYSRTKGIDRRLLSAQPANLQASSAAFPAIDFDALGSVGVAGSFAGLDIWSSSDNSSANTYDPAASTLLHRNSDGTLTKLNATEAGGVISTVCGQSSGAGMIVAGGSFSKMGDVSTANIAAYDPSTGQWDDMAGGIEGTITSVLCLEEIVVVGGNFTAPAEVDAQSVEGQRYLGNVAAWNFTSQAWQALDFGGLNGTVQAMVAGANTSMVQFGGTFDTAFGNSSALGASTDNATAISGTYTSPSALSAKWAPISLAMSYFEGGPSLNNDNFNMAPQILCPQGADGSGNTAGSLSRVRAFRLGNTFHDGRGTQNFSITSFSSDSPIELLYLDPATNKNVTCTTQCQMHHNASVPYQDFLVNARSSDAAIDGTVSLTGFSLNVTGWHGAGAGLHMLEVFAYRSYNRGACNSTVEGVNGDCGIREGVLQLSDSYSNLASHSSAQVSFQVDLAVRGNYTGYLHCNDRTDVLVTVINNSTNSGTSITVSQNVEADTDIAIWDGEVDPTSENFMPSVVLSIPTDASEPSSGNFTVVADRVRFVLRNSTEIFQSNATAVKKGFGVFSYDIIDPEVQALTNVNATGVIPNASLTSLDAFGVTLLGAGVTRATDEHVYALTTIGDVTFVGGAFASTVFNGSAGFQNIVAFDNRQNASETVAVTRLDSGGLNGPVMAMAALQNLLFVGGNFTSPAGSSADLAYVARYDPAKSAWAAFPDGPNGPVTSVAALGEDGLLIAGNFTQLGSNDVPGYAIWNETTMAWVTEQSFIVGVISSISAVNGTAYMVGSVSAVSANAAAGAAGLKAPATDGDVPQVTSLNFTFVPGDTSSTTASSSRRRSLIAQQNSALKKRGDTRNARAIPAHSQPAQRRSMLGRLLSGLLRRQDVSSDQASSTAQADAIEPASLQDDGTNQIMASAFWQRSDGVSFTIVGGRFNTTSGVSNLGLYDQSATALESFPAYPTQNGSLPTLFRALTVVDNTLYAGGDGGLVVFDLTNGTWLSAGQELSATDSANLTVTAIAHRPDNAQVIVAGNFDTAGMLPCLNVCLWDMDTHRWSPLGSGVSGQITAIDYAGTSASHLIVAGEMTVGGTSASLQGWDFSAQNWTAFGSVGTGSGQVPGPATAAVVDDLSLSSIFVAGRYADGAAPYLAKWDGSQYELLGAEELEANTGIAQLTFVPITEAHPSNNVLENNRLLVVSGALTMTSYGNLSSAFFDGVNWTPFLRTTSTTGGSGIVRAISRSTETLKFPNLSTLAVGLVILISIAIGLGIVFLLVLIGLLIALARRRPNRGVDVPISPSDEMLSAEKKRPTSLLATLNAATENVMGAGAAGAGLGAMTTTAGTSSSGHYRGESMPLTSEDHDYTNASSNYHSEAQTGRSAYYTDDGTTEGHTAMTTGANTTRGGIDAHMRFSFEATHPSELGVRAGDAHWWLARSDDGRIGVVPASYVL